MEKDEEGTTTTTTSTTTIDEGGENTREESSVKEEGPPASLEKLASDSNLFCVPDATATQPLIKDTTKIDILLKATGNAPIMKKKKWAVSQDQHIGWISDFIKRYLKLNSGERLFLYINQTFAPAPDQTVKNLYDCYGTDGKLIIHYCKSQAWG